MKYGPSARSGGGRNREQNKAMGHGQKEGSWKEEGRGKETQCYSGSNSFTFKYRVGYGEHAPGSVHHLTVLRI